MAIAKALLDRQRDVGQHALHVERRDGHARQGVEHGQLLVAPLDLLGQPLGLLIEPRAGDRPADLRGDGLQQVDILVGEAIGLS